MNKRKFPREMMQTGNEESMREAVLAASAGSTAPCLASADRVRLLKPLADEAKKLLDAAKATGDERLLDLAVQTLSGIITAL